MIDFLTQHASTIGSFLAGFVGGGAVGSLVTLRIKGRNQLPGKGSIVDQSRSRAGGDIVGGNNVRNGGRR
ncbi:hypothetical protein [Bradyrhizobium sp. SZCCHNS3002]|uniref:hypothetical protein n=1 Tax=Bradyrhizobium sp. SZCCHNS3002 TaxID=3057310 RepID=UPI0028EEA948|nr:hypothetical protein [Bradyrhizobium sp. SZCCHNS3002]